MASTTLDTRCRGFLRRLTRRSILSEEEQQAICDLPGRTATVPANEEFVRLGEEVDHACILLEGFAARFEQTADGSRQITAISIPGDMPDLQSTVLTRTTSGLQALGQCTVLRVPHSALRGLAGRYPAIAEAFWRDCVVDASIAFQWLVNIGRRTAAARTAHLICEIACRSYAVHGRHISFPFPITQIHIADALGLTAVHVNRTLRLLRDEGLVRLTRQDVVIMDWPALAAHADFDPSYLMQGDERPQRLSLAESGSR